MSDVAATGSAPPISLLDSALKANETTVTAEVEVLAKLLKTQTDFFTEVFQALGVGTQVDITA